MKLEGQHIYLAMLERKDCKTLWNDFEYDFNCPAEEFNIGHSDEKADGWFDEIQKLQGNQNVRLGIFLNDGTVIGDVALQDIDRVNRKCTVGMGIAKIANRSKGYGREAITLMLYYGFRFLEWSGFLRTRWRSISERRKRWSAAVLFWKGASAKQFT